MLDRKVLVRLGYSRTLSPISNVRGSRGRSCPAYGPATVVSSTTGVLASVMGDLSRLTDRPVQADRALCLLAGTDAPGRDRSARLAVRLSRERSEASGMPG